jgi:subtilisin family serine protease
MNYNRFGISLGIGLIAVILCLTGCHVVDDQTIIKTEDRSIGNPAPKPRDFAQNNLNHKVLLAVIDTGVDYNHPLLKNNMHFTLDQTGTPIGFGFDYVANDQWASPYIVRTSTDYKPQGPDQVKKVFVARYIAAAFEQMALYQPKLADFVESRRNVTQEIDGETFHGTHVAGLMTYDKPSFGLLAYRVLPINDLRHDGMAKSDVDENDLFDANLIAAIHRAAKDGARVVNMSLGMSFKKGDPDFEKNLQRANRIKAAIEKYPNVLFVSAAGNDSTWLDNQTSFSMPCGLKASNQLCVGATGSDDHLASFTNILLENVDLVFSLGVDVISTFPSKMCFEDNIDSDIKIQAENSWNRGQSSLQVVPEKIRFSETEKAKFKENAFQLVNSCAKHTGLEKLSGTSMATPFVSRIAGEIFEANPSLNAIQAIQAIKARTKSVNLGPLPIYILEVDKPSWYRTIPNPLAEIYSPDGRLYNNSEKFQFKVITH